jgi:hypothetical protein
MKTPRIKIGWKAVLLAGPVLGALVTAAIVGAGQYATAGGPNSNAHVPGREAPAMPENVYNGAAVLDTFDRATALHNNNAPEAADQLATLDSFDRATALHNNNAAELPNEVSVLDTFDRATALRQSNAPDEGAGGPLLDTFDRATALKQSGVSSKAEDLTDLSDRHTHEELLDLLGGASR